MDINKIMEDVRAELELRMKAYVCPVHGTSPKVTIEDDKHRLNCCCQVLADLIPKDWSKRNQ
jgi:hypothetical protein